MQDPVLIPFGSPFTLGTSDSGIAHGYGIFETIRMKQGHLLHWAEHWKRMQESAAALGLQCSYCEDSVLHVVGRLIEWDALENATLKLSLLRGGRGEQLYVYARPSIEWPKSVRLNWRPDCPLNATSPLTGHKTHNYMENIYLLEMARNAGFDDCLRPAPCGSVGETTVANLLWFADGVLHTPSADLGILPGVVRSVLLRLAPHLGVPCREGAFSLESLESAEAVFISNASIGLRPVRSIEGNGMNQQFNSSEHPLFLKLSEALLHEQQETAILPPVPKPS